METEDLDKILSKSYSELNTAERETIQEICGSEEEFLQLQQFFASVESYAKETQEDFPAAETKHKLDDLFQQTYQKKGILWYNAVWTAIYPTERRFDQRPLVRIAAILVVLISIVPFLNSPESRIKAPLAKMEATQKEEAVSAPEVEEKTIEKKETAKFDMNQAQASGYMTLEDSYTSISAADEMAPVEAANGPAYSFTLAPAVPMGAATTFSTGSNSYAWTHSDGIYMDTFTYDSDAFTVRGNMAVLDLLTPTF